jgi:hypothetical protein
MGDSVNDGACGGKYFGVNRYALIVSMYGGGIAIIPAYLRDLFGTMQVGTMANARKSLVFPMSRMGLSLPALAKFR